MSESDQSMSINSLMEAIYGDHHHTEYLSEIEDQQQNYSQQLSQFMQSLINHLIQLCMTQGAVQNVQRLLMPWVREAKTNTRNPKSSLQGFLKNFLRLLEQETTKISKYGEKKLKYLTQTVSKQIFTQIMRLSCDLKFQSVNRANSAKNNLRKVNNVTILMHSIDRIFTREQSTMFRILKKSYQESIRKQQGFVYNLENSIKKLDRICEKTRNLRLWKAMTSWRIKSIQIQQEETVSLCTLTKQFYSSVLPLIVNAWKDRPLASISIIVQQLSFLFKELKTNIEGTEVQFLGNPCFCNNSLDYSAISSYRSSVSQVSSISITEYLKNEQIKFDNNSKFLAIPMIVGDEQIGLVKISWQYQLPITLFNKILKLTQSLKQLILGLSKISTRLAYYVTEYEANSWHEQLYSLCLRQQPLQLKSLEMILDAANIKYLQIYHDRTSPDACIKYGKQNAAPIPQNIYQLIWDKLQFQSMFKLDREDRNYEIAKLDQHGFCRYSLEYEQINTDQSKTKNAVLQCIVPLLTKNFGKIGCQSCKIQVKQLKIHEKQKQKQNQEEIKPIIRKNYNFQSLMNIKDAKSIQNAEDQVLNLIKNYFPQQKVLTKVFYNVEDSKNMYAFRRKKNGKSTVQMTQIHKGLANGNICTIQVNEQNKNLRQLSKILQSGALFQQPEMYLYSNQKSKPLKVIPKKLGRKCLILFATYDDIDQSRVKQILDVTTGELQKNQHIFKKQDLYAWKSEVLMANKPTPYFNQKIDAEQLQKICQLGFSFAVEKVCKSLTFVKKVNLWRITSTLAIDLMLNTKTDIQKFPKCFLESQPFRSHYNVNGDRRVLKNSLNFGQKLEQQLTYIPVFSDEQHKLSYIQAACSDVPETNQFSDSRYSQICEFLSRENKTQQLQYQFMCIPVCHMSRCYTLLLFFQKTAPITPTMYTSTVSYIQRCLSQIISTTALKSKVVSLQKLSNLKKQRGGIFFDNPTTKIREIVQIFKKLRQFKEEQKKKLANSIQGVQAKVTFRVLRDGFGAIRDYAVGVRRTYVRACEFAIARIFKIFFIRPFMQVLSKNKSKNVGTQKLIESLNKMINNLCIPSRVTSHTFFNKLKQNSHIKIESLKSNKINSVQKLEALLANLHRRNTIQYFSKTVENHHSLKRSLIILQEQFKLVDPKSMKSAISFLQGRLNLMVNQHYRMAILITVHNFGFLNFAESEVNKNNLVFVRNTSFALEIGKDQREVQGLSKLIQPILYQFLPQWEVNYRKNQNFRLKIIYQILQRLRTSTLSRIFNIHNSQKFLSLTEQQKTLKAQVSHESEVLSVQKQNWNPNKNQQRREKHRKQITELKQNIGIIQNQMDKISVEGKIKSKTNAAYRMLLIMGRNEDRNIGKVDKKENQVKVRDIKNSIKEERKNFVCQNMGLWAASVKSMIKRSQRSNMEYFFHVFTQTHL